MAEDDCADREAETEELEPQQLPLPFPLTEEAKVDLLLEKVEELAEILEEVRQRLLDVENYGRY